MLLEVEYEKWKKWGKGEDAKYITGWKLNCKAGLNLYGEATERVVKVGKSIITSGKLS